MEVADDVLTLCIGAQERRLAEQMDEPRKACGSRSERGGCVIVEAKCDAVRFELVHGSFNDLRELRSGHSCDPDGNGDPLQRQMVNQQRGDVLRNTDQEELEIDRGGVLDEGRQSTGVPHRVEFINNQQDAMTTGVGHALNGIKECFLRRQLREAGLLGWDPVFRVTSASKALTSAFHEGWAVAAC